MYSNTGLRRRRANRIELRKDPLHTKWNDWRYPNENEAAARGVPHPARFSYRLYDVFVELLRTEYGEVDDFLVLDPFAGIGGIHNIAYYLPNALTVGVEIEKEWAECHPDTVHGNSFFLDRMFEPNTFDAVLVSPTYGNRMADNFTPKDTSKRLSYKITLGRKLTPGTTANLQWGKHYRDLHYNIWRKCYGVIRPGGLFILNIKDHIRDHKIIPVTDFHIDALTQIGFVMESHDFIALNGYRYGSNFQSRMKHESVIQFRKPLDA